MEQINLVMRLVSIFILIIYSQFNFAQNFTLKSNDLGGQASNQQVFKGFGCEGENVSPHLSWHDAPRETQSFAITIHDESAPTGSGWWHWTVFNIPPDIHELISNAGDPKTNLMPFSAIQIKNDYGLIGYGGPCPPPGHGIHKYTVTVYALKIKDLGIDKNATAPISGFYINSNTIAKASLVFYYSR